ncbi:MAG: UDP-N-acetylmuramate dehydrogenase [Mycobacteriales bacterium]|nr:UDP-N-acetylmuramate dehydrogenase [Mycobacteriales bacterium]
MLLADLTTLGLGGPADDVAEARTEAELVEAVRSLDAAGTPVLVVGGGSNLVVADGGFPGTVVRVLTTGVDELTGGAVSVAAGEDWDGVVARLVAQGRAGVEALSGIPGATGATPVQNVGAYGQDLSQTCTGVRALDRSSGEVLELGAADCDFRYRHSRFKAERDRWVVLSVHLSLETGPLSAPVRYAELARALGVDVGDRAPLAEVREAVLGLRRGKGMVVDPADPDSRSAGSFFTNPVLTEAQLDALRGRLPDVSVPAYPDQGGWKVSAAWLIERAGFAKGDLDGPVGLSTKHVLALVNRGGGTTQDLLRAARTVRDAVRDRLGVVLVAEPVLVGVEL